MNRIKSTGDSIKKKLLSNQPIIKVTSEEFDELKKNSISPESQYTIKPASQQASKKKVTFYIPIEIEGKLNEIYTRKMMNNEKEDKSSLICRAIELLWKEEKKYEL